MNTSAFVACLFSLLVIFALVGCSPPQPEGYEINPFGDGCNCPDCQCPTGTCPAACPDATCPDGTCPAPRSPVEISGDVGGVEIGGQPAAPVDTIAQGEPKTGAPCPTCPNVSPSIPSSAAAIPTAPPIRDHPPAGLGSSPRGSTLDEPKTGNFACQSCNRTTIGQEWREIWTDDGRSILCLCRDCDARLTPAAREAVLRRYLSAAGVDVDRDPSMHAAVMSASRAPR